MEKSVTKKIEVCRTTRTYIDGSKTNGLVVTVFVYPEEGFNLGDSVLVKVQKL